MSISPSRTALNSKILIIGHYIFCSIGLLVLTHVLGIHLGIDLATYLNSGVHYYAWAQGVLEVRKPAELLGYIIPAAILFLYYSLAYFHLQRHTQFKNSWLTKMLRLSSSNSFLVTYLAALFLSNALVMHWLKNSSNDYLVGMLTMWLLLFLFPFLDFPRIKKVRSIIGGALLIGILVQLWWVFLPYIKSSPLLISNDYMSIPEQTKMGDQYIDNLRYINQNHLGGLLRYDPRLSHGQSTFKANIDYIPLAKTDKLMRYVSTHQNKFYYDKFYQGLFIDDVLLGEDAHTLCELVSNQVECRLIYQFYQSSANDAKAEKNYTKQGNEFVEKNRYELIAQSFIGHYFHHHNALLGSINEYAQGKPQAKSVFLYGWLNAILLAALLKLSGGISFASYIKLTYFFYPLYYTLIAIASFILFRDIWRAFFITIISIAGLYLIGYEGIHMAPGFNPIRHFFDMIVLLTFYNYLFAERKKQLLLIFVVLSTLLAYFLDKEFGFFILIGIVAALIFKFIEAPRFKLIESIVISLGIFAIFTVSFLVKTGSNSVAIYYFTGVSIPVTSLAVVRNILLLISIIYAALIFSPWQDKRWKYIAVFLLFYGQTSLIYFIWNPSLTHLYSIMVPWLFLGVILFNELMQYQFLSRYKQPLFFILAFMMVANYYFSAFASYHHDGEKYAKVFENHRLYHWNMPAAQFVSTMDPAPFLNAIQLIDKYSTGKGIYLISKYDNLLPILSIHYSIMPFLETAVSLVSEKEMQEVADVILKDKPKYLFVDSDISVSRRGDIFKRDDPITMSLGVYALSRNRALVLDNLSTLFTMVKSDYEPIESGQLITVYQRKQKTTG